MKRALMLAAVLCLAAVAADDTAVAPRQATSLKPQAPSLEADAITIPQMLSYQGKLTDINGVPVPDSTWSLVFRLYTVASGGSPFWNETQPVKTTGGLFSVLLGSVTPIGLMPDAGTVYLGMSVSGGAELSPRTRIVSTAYAYKADTANYAGAAPPSGVAGGDLAGSYPSPTVDGLQGRAVIGTAPGYGQVLKWNGNQWAPANDSIGSGGGTVTSVSQTTGVICSPNPITTTGTVGLNVTYTDGRYVDVAGDSITDDLAIQDELRVYDRARIGPNCQNTATQSFAVGNGCIASGNRSSVLGGWQNTADGNDATVGGGANNYAGTHMAFVGGGQYDSASARYCAVVAGYGNTSGNSSDDTAAFVGGGSGNSATARYATVGGGFGNSAAHVYATVGGGRKNTTVNTYTTIAGGDSNSISGGAFSAIGGGRGNTANGEYAAISGGWGNTAYYYSSVAGGYHNSASGQFASVAGGANDSAVGIFSGALSGRGNVAGNAGTDTGVTVAGGHDNKAYGRLAFIGGGEMNLADGLLSTVGGGFVNSASGQGATVAGGWYDTSAASYSFTTGRRSVVPSPYSNSAAFNGQTATASNQTRVGTLSKAGGSFTIDHPLDPNSKMLNHYFIEGPEMRNIYEGSVVLNGYGRAEVNLPDYFDALNRNPHVQLTGVGTYEVYVAEEVVGDRFVIGGKPGTKVFWTVTGERKDVSAEAMRRMMPVEQPKTGALAGRMLDDEFLSGCMEQLTREGKSSGIDFRTAGGRQRYEKMRRMSEQR